MESLRSISPEMREFKLQPFEIINIPEPEDDVVNSRCLLKRRKLAGMIEQNISYLQDILEYSRSHESFWLPTGLKDYIDVATKVFAVNKDRLSDYIKAKTVEDLIRREVVVNEINISENMDTRDKEIREAVTSNFKRTKGNKISMSVSHGATWFALKAAHEAKENESAQIGMIVFDNHVDIYTHWCSRHVNKGNSFRLLGNDGTIERVVFIGGLDDSRLIAKENRRLEMNGKVAKYEQIGIDSLKRDGKTDRYKLLDKLDEVVRSYKESGITNIVFSIDIDVLRAERMGYTGFEYNPINILERVSSISDLHDLLCKDPSELTQLDLDKLDRTIGGSDWLGYLKCHNPVGLALGDIGISLDAIVQNCKKYGLKLGIKLTGGGTYFGDIVEMSGPDYKGRTTRSSVALLKRIEQIVQNYQ